jgi:hypothetical protein
MDLCITKTAAGNSSGHASNATMAHDLERHCPSQHATDASHGLSRRLGGWLEPVAVAPLQPSPLAAAYPPPLALGEYTQSNRCRVGSAADVTLAASPC